MVKSLLAIAVAASLLLGAGLFEWFYVNDLFGDFGGELNALCLKAEDGTASGEDAKAVQASWERRKEELHVWIPHNDVRLIDDYLSETVGLISRGETSLALAKLSILIHLTECLPDTYKPGIANIF